VHADVELDHDVERRLARERVGEPARAGLRVHDRPHPHGSREVAQPPQPLGADERVADEQVITAVAGEHLGLGQLRARQPDRAERELAAGDRRALVRLDVRAQRDAVRRAGVGDLGEVALERGEVDPQVGRLECRAHRSPTTARCSIARM